MEPSSQTVDNSTSSFPLPRVTIKFCTQCKWLLRAAYFAQELLSTFSTSLGEVALQPSTGGVFVVEITHSAPPPPPQAGTTTAPTITTSSQVLWDRKVDGGFPETAELKRRVRNVIDPGRDLGHVDRTAPRFHNPNDLPPPSSSSSSSNPAPTTAATMTSPLDPAVAPTANASDDTSENAPLPRPRDLAAAAAGIPHHRAVPAGLGGVKPIIRQPPAHLQEAAEARLAEARAAKEVGAEGEVKEKKDGEKEACKDCE